MDTKKLIESLIEDLYENKSLSDVFLKLQVVVYLLKNEQLQEWFDSENNGYSTDRPLPSYRILDVRVCANLLQDRGFGSYITRNNYHFHIDMIKDKDFRRKVSTNQFRQAISEINNWITNQDGNSEAIKFIPINSALYISKFSEQLINSWQIQSIWIEVSKSSVQNIISQIKSKLLQFLLEINESLNLNISFTEMENKEKIEKAFEQNITNNFYGDKNNVATGQNVVQNINQSTIDYEKLREYGVEEQHIEELKIIEKESDRNTLREKAVNWFSNVSSSVVAQSLSANIPKIMETIKGLIT